MPVTDEIQSAIASIKAIADKYKDNKDVLSAGTQAAQDLYQIFKGLLDGQAGPMDAVLGEYQDVNETMLAIQDIESQENKGSVDWNAVANDFATVFSAAVKVAPSAIALAAMFARKSSGVTVTPKTLSAPELEAAAKPRHLLAAFDQGQIPTIDVVNKATVDWGVDPIACVNMMQTYVDKHVGPVWGVAAKFRLVDKIAPGHWGFIFQDEDPEEGALGHHFLTPNGMPCTIVGVQTTLNDGELVSVTAAHEAAEMLVDPGVAMGYQAPDGTWYAAEVCDAVEEEIFKIKVKDSKGHLVDVETSNFVYPAYFEGFRAALPGHQKYDHLGNLKAPFSINHGGYMPIEKNGTWDQVFGSKRKEFKIAHQSSRHHRRGVKRGKGANTHKRVSPHKAKK